MERDLAMIKLVIFDLAGTTVQDGEGLVAQELQAALSEFGYSIPLHEVTATMGIPKKVAIQQLAGPEAPIEAIHHSFQHRMIQTYRCDPDIREIEGVSDLFRTLHEANILVAVDTGFDRETVEALFSRLNWEGLVDGSICSDEVERGRPFPDMAIALMDRLGTVPETTAKVGDTPNDLAEGHAAGCLLNIGVTYGTHSKEQLSLFPHTHLVDTIQELTMLLVKAEAPSLERT